MATLADLRAHADHALLSGQFQAALHAYTDLVLLAPSDLDARLRIGDALLALGEVQSAAIVYTALARYAAHTGYPLRALVALKVLSALEPKLESLLGSLAELYAVGSPRLGRGVRPAPADLAQPVPPGYALAAPPERAALVQRALGVASDYTPLGNQVPERVPPIPLFSELPADSFARVLAALKLRRVRPGDTVIAEGEPGASFFVIARGALDVVKRTAQGDVTTLATLQDGAIFGEMALVSASPRTATVVARTDADLLEFDRDALAAASREAHTIARALDKFTRERLLSNLLATAPLFRPLDRRQRIDLARRFTAHDVVAGTEIIREGTPGRGLFLLLSGEVDVSKVDGEEKVLLATLKAGDVFGEISLVRDRLTTATVTAARTSTVLFLAREYFQRLVAAVPEIRTYVESVTDERLLDTRLLLDGQIPDAGIAVDVDEDDSVLV